MFYISRSRDSDTALCGVNGQVAGSSDVTSRVAYISDTVGIDPKGHQSTSSYTVPSTNAHGHSPDLCIVAPLRGSWRGCRFPQRRLRHLGLGAQIEGEKLWFNGPQARRSHRRATKPNTSTSWASATRQHREQK